MSDGYTTCPRCKGSGEGATVYIGESAPHCGLCHGTGAVKPTCPRCGIEDIGGCFDPVCPCIPERKP